MPASKVKAIVEATLHTTPPDATHWSTRTHGTDRWSKDLLQMLAQIEEVSLTSMEERLRSKGA